MPDQTADFDKEAAMQRLRELVLDHLGIPRPRQSAHLQALQDDLLPAFMDLARHAWLASSPYPLEQEKLGNWERHPVYDYLFRVTETYPQKVRQLDSILEDLGVHALLEDIGRSPDAALLAEVPLDPYERRLLRAAGHPEPEAAVRAYLRYATAHPEVLRGSSGQLDQAGAALLKAHGNITVVIDVNATPPPQAPANPPAPKPKRMKLFGGIGKLAGGLVLLTGNAMLIPSVTIVSIAALPVLGSLAAGIGGVGEGVSSLLREGE